MSTDKTDRPTDRQVDPAIVPDYISVRLTVSHNEWPKIVSSVLHDRSYIAYPHIGKSATNPHFHIFVPSDDLARDADCMRNRIKRAFGGGNKTLSVVQKSNGIMSAIQYGSREGTVPFVSDADLQGIIDRSPPWEEQVVKKKKYGQVMIPPSEDSEKKSRTDRDWQLTYSNLVTQAVLYARREKLTGSLKEVVREMCVNTKWKPSFQMVKQGVPDHYYKDFEFRTGKRKLYDMDWMDPKF